MKIDFNFKVRLTPEEVKEILAAEARRLACEKLSGFDPDGTFEARCDYGYQPPVVVEYEPKEEPEPIPVPAIMEVTA